MVKPFHSNRARTKRKTANHLLGLLWLPLVAIPLRGQQKVKTMADGSTITTLYNTKHLVISDSGSRLEKSICRKSTDFVKY